MTKQIGTEVLREWLDRHKEVIVLDVRSDEDRSQWFVPGSVHVNAYEALKSGKPDALAGLSVPPNVPVVTVCNLGITSQTAAQQLEARGVQAMALKGGMKAWSLAWNTADVSLTHSGATVVQVRRTGKGCQSYLLGSGDQAIVLDAALPPDIYMDLAAQRGWGIRAVIETHVHADHLSRSRVLANETGARLLIPMQQRRRYPFESVSDGAEVAFGTAKLKAVRTPGHTPESTCYVLDEEALFTGDTLFHDGVGRPDLHGSSSEPRERAALLYRSLRKLVALSPSLLVFPGHASTPIAFDGKAMTAPLSEISHKLEDWFASEDGFVNRILQRIPPTPPNFARITELNEAGILPEGDPTDLEAGANRCAVS